MNEGYEENIRTREADSAVNRELGKIQEQKK
jgi:hypothetical protein